MIAERESAGFLVAETINLLRVNAGLALIGLGVLTALEVAGDLYPDFSRLASIASFVATLVLQYEISSALLSHYGLLDGGPYRRRLWALLGVSLVSGLGIALGLIALIVPGVYLFVRWSAAVPAMIAEEAGVYDSLGLSADAVEGRFWHVFAAILIVWTPFGAALLASVMVPEGERLIESLLLNISINLSLIAGWHLAVAVYAGRQDGNRLAEVFA
jgi:hypothetical protein